MEKIVYLDVDGTIIGPDQKLSQKTINTIIKIQQHGIKVALATGRNFSEIQPIALPLEIDKYLNYSVAENGAYITKVDNPITIGAKTLDLDEVKKLTKYFQDLKIDAFYSSYQTPEYVYRLFYDEQKPVHFMIPKLEYAPISKIKDWSTITMIAFEDLTSREDEVTKYLKNNFTNLDLIIWNGTKTSSPFYMLNAKGVSKLSGIQNLNKLLKIADNNVYFFGDGVNDLPAIKYFKHSYVPKNALNQVKKEAKNLIDSVGNDGVAKKLEELFLN